MIWDTGEYEVRPRYSQIRRAKETDDDISADSDNVREESSNIDLMSEPEKLRKAFQDVSQQLESVTTFSLTFPRGMFISGSTASAFHQATPSQCDCQGKTIVANNQDHLSVDGERRSRKRKPPSLRRLILIPRSVQARQPHRRPTRRPRSSKKQLQLRMTKTGTLSRGY